VTRRQKHYFCPDSGCEVLSNDVIISLSRLAVPAIGGNTLGRLVYQYNTANYAEAAEFAGYMRQVLYYEDFEEAGKQLTALTSHLPDNAYRAFIRDFGNQMLETGLIDSLDAVGAVAAIISRTRTQGDDLGKRLAIVGDIFHIFKGTITIPAAFKAMFGARNNAVFKNIVDTMNAQNFNYQSMLAALENRKSEMTDRESTIEVLREEMNKELSELEALKSAAAANSKNQTQEAAILADDIQLVEDTMVAYMAPENLNEATIDQTLSDFEAASESLKALKALADKNLSYWGRLTDGLNFAMDATYDSLEASRVNLVGEIDLLEEDRNVIELISKQIIDADFAKRITSGEAAVVEAATNEYVYALGSSESASIFTSGGTLMKSTGLLGSMGNVFYGASSAVCAAEQAETQGHELQAIACGMKAGGLLVAGGIGLYEYGLWVIGAESIIPAAAAGPIGVTLFMLVMAGEIVFYYADQNLTIPDGGSESGN